MLGTRFSVLGMDVGEIWVIGVIRVMGVGDEILITKGVGIKVAVGTIVGLIVGFGVALAPIEVGVGNGDEVGVGLQLQSVDWSQSGFLQTPS